MSLVIAIATDLIAITLLAYALYFRRHRRRDLMLSYIALNVGVVAVTIALSSVEVGIGLGIGLFGILSIIRLRSDQITQQEIAYYFVSLALGLLAGLQPSPIWVTPVLSALMLTVMLVVDSPRVAPRTRRHTLTLDRAFMSEAALSAHLEQLLDARVTRVELLDVDMVRDTTLVDVRYSDRTAQVGTAGDASHMTADSTMLPATERSKDGTPTQGRFARFRPVFGILSLFRNTEPTDTRDRTSVGVAPRRQMTQAAGSQHSQPPQHDGAAAHTNEAGMPASAEYTSHAGAASDREPVTR